LNTYLYRQLSLLLFVLLSLSCVPAQAQPNACSVTAAIAPGDTIVPENTLFTVSSTSTGATTLEWYINNSHLYTPASSFTYACRPGTYEIMLVASNGNCRDTAYRSILCVGTPHARDTFLLAQYGFYDVNEYASCVDNTAEGGYVMGGEAYIYQDRANSRPYMVKISEDGCVEWSRIIESQWGGKIAHVLGCADSSIVAAGYGGLGLVRLDKDGRELWKKNYLVNGLGSTFHRLAEDADGATYALVGHGAFYQGLSVVKLNKDGTVAWNKYYRATHRNEDMLYPEGLVFLNGDLYVSGTSSIYTPNGYRWDNFILKLGAADGQTRWIKSYTMKDGTSNFGRLSTYHQLLMVSATGTRTGDKLGHTVVLLEQDGSFHKGLHLTHHDNKATNLNAHFNLMNGMAESDGKGNIYLMNTANMPLFLQPYYQSYSYFLKIDTAQNLEWGAAYSSYPRGQFVQAALNRSGKWGAVGNEFGYTENGSWASRNLMFLKMQAPLVGPVSCTFSTRAFDFSRVDYQVQALSMVTDSVLTYAYSEPASSVNTVYSEARFLCPDFIDSCSLLQVTGPASVCQLSGTYTYRAGRNRFCAQPVEWQVEGPLQVMARTDSTLTVRFSGFGHYKIAAQLLYTCSPKRDSLVVQVVSKTPPLELGLDTSLCAGNTLLLRAGSRFLAYQWQDGSTDSLFTVSAPGVYRVQVTDSCGNTLNDTIRVVAAAAVTIDLGPDRTKCNADTLQLQAPAGFMNYRWSNNYHLSSTTGQNVVVSPPVDTAYYLQAEKTPGCFAWDTVRVRVYTSPPIALGADTSFCRGGQVALDAGAGFAAYTWSTGATVQHITVSDKGTYWVVATTTEGCASADTLVIGAVHPLPVVNLGSDNTLCTGGERVLDAGSFSAYLWNNGATGRTIRIGEPGTYAVTVTDTQGCSTSGSLVIDRLLPRPQGFLPPDTAICSYGTLLLQPSAVYAKYTWSSGSTAPSLTIDRPGRYTLEVTDGMGCTGRDEIVINPKECLKGLYVPNAFTPNKDGKNDRFRALLFGPVKSYQLTVYNRWGEAVFQTTDHLQGWDGTIKGRLQDTGVFVWTCRYQLEGEDEKMEKGTVVVIR
jgi:gliding motility-associated-like protein